MCNIPQRTVWDHAWEGETGWQAQYPGGVDRNGWERAIARSYAETVGEAWLRPEELMAAPAVVLTHDTGADPLFVYANLTAQALWGRSWDEFIGWPSRMTAPPEHRGRRAAALSSNAVVKGYSGVRIDRSGRLFEILDATVWPVYSEGDTSTPPIGQAATFARWRPLPDAQAVD